VGVNLTRYLSLSLSCLSRLTGSIRLFFFICLNRSLSTNEVLWRVFHRFPDEIFVLFLGGGGIETLLFELLAAGAECNRG
jgi:hypothetical protein